MHNYSQHFSKQSTPQTEQADPAQRANNAGGYSFAVDAWGRLERFLILGSEGGTYYVGERKLTKDNAKNVIGCLQTDPGRAVQTIVDISQAGRAPKNDAAIFALALACAEPAASAHAFAALPKVCRTGTHLFQFCEMVKGQRGWGPGLRKAIARWYGGRSVEHLLYQVTKYRNRTGWTHKAGVRVRRSRRSTTCRWMTSTPV